VFLFDEPLSNLDAKLRVQMRVEIKRLQQELRVTSLYVTHDQVEAMTLADRLIVMNAGNADQIGPPLDLYERPATAFVAGFIGSPAMNLVAGRFDETGVAIGNCLLPVAHRGGEAGSEVTIGLRPEHLDIAADGPLPLTVELLERLGADTIVHGRLDGDSVLLTARAAGTIDPPLGEVLRFAVRSEHIHLFDSETGRRL
jgi:sn-glycerol 3-phosphate transport system ATP-binding protein